MVNFQYEGRENRFFLYLVTVKVRRNIWVPYKESNLRPLHFLLWCTAAQRVWRVQASIPPRELRFFFLTHGQNNTDKISLYNNVFWKPMISIIIGVGLL